MKKYFILSVLLAVGMTAAAQDWEYVRIYDSYDSIRPNCMQSLTEFESGDRGLWRNHDSWIMIEKLNRNFELVQEVYYPYQESTNLNCNSYYVTRDGGVLLLSYCHELDNKNINHYILTKFPVEAFVGIDEAHDNGLKVAIAYPNPGGNTLNIRTAVTMWQPYKAHVEVYDMNGRLIHSQTLTENMTAINTEKWPSGVYVWKVMAVSEPVVTELVETPFVETGKWVKE